MAHMWTIDSWNVWWYIVASVVIVLCIGIRCGVKTPLFGVAVVYWYMAFGPVINYAMGWPIYFGVITSNIPMACLMFNLALAGMLAASLIWQNGGGGIVRDYFQGIDRRRTFLREVLVVLSVIGCVMLARLAVAGIGSDKVTRIALIGPGYHYLYLLLQFCALPFYFIARRSRTVFTWYVVNAVLYVTYSLLTSERDFIFIVASVVLHRLCLREIRISSRMIALTVLCGYVMTLMFSFRFSGGSVNVETFLGQGSLLFISTYVLYLVPGMTPFQGGASYVGSVASLLPSSLVGERSNLLTWFQNWYAPGSTSGYGFSLDAEAYLNFGVTGVFIVFFLLSVFVLASYRRFGVSEFWSYFSVYFVAGLMYAFRNDSWFLIHGCVYATLFYWVAQSSIRTSPGSVRPAERLVEVSRNVSPNAP